jgi:hypothetical protein
MAAPSKARYVRERKFRRLRGVGRNILRAFLTAQGTRLAASATARTCTFANATDIITSTSHGFVTGKGPIVFSNSGGALPAGITANTPYYPVRIDANTFRISRSRQIGAVVPPTVDFTTDGTGTNTAAYQSTAAAFLERLRQRLKPRTLRAATDIDNL